MSFFDFALLGKPVIYAHFDYEEFFSSHSYTRGHFSYEENGFGPVCTSLDDLLDELERTIQNDCTIEDTYKQRADDLFYQPKTSRCEEIVQAILNMDDAYTS